MRLTLRSRFIKLVRIRVLALVGRGGAAPWSVRYLEVRYLDATCVFITGQRHCRCPSSSIIKCMRNSMGETVGNTAGNTLEARR